MILTDLQKRVSTGIVGIAVLILIFYLGLNAIKFSILFFLWINIL